MFDWLERYGWHFDKIPFWLIDASRKIHNFFWRDTNQSLCARTWATQNRFWLMVLGPDHCERCHRHWNSHKAE